METTLIGSTPSTTESSAEIMHKITGLGSFIRNQYEEALELNAAHVKKINELENKIAELTAAATAAASAYTSRRTFITA